MSRDLDSTAKQTGTPESRRGKTYQKPEILSRESIEVLAVVCTDPRSKTQGVCTIVSS